MQIVDSIQNMSVKGQIGWVVNVFSGMNKKNCCPYLLTIDYDAEEMQQIIVY